MFGIRRPADRPGAPKKICAWGSRDAQSRKSVMNKVSRQKIEKQLYRRPDLGQAKARR
jgi:hypothetical protein